MSCDSNDECVLPSGSGTTQVSASAESTTLGASGVAPCHEPDTKRPEVSIQVYQHDWIPGFAAFHPDGSIQEGAAAHVVLNLGSLLAAVHTGDLNKKDLPYMIAESLMHETVHVLEEWANVEFSEQQVEELLAKYRQKYERATIWEYTGKEPSETVVEESK